MSHLSRPTSLCAHWSLPNSRYLYTPHVKPIYLSLDSYIPLIRYVYTFRLIRIYLLRSGSFGERWAKARRPGYRWECHGVEGYRRTLFFCFFRKRVAIISQMMGTLVCGERGIQTPGTDKPFTGFRVRPNRSLWHLSFVRVCLSCAKKASTARQR